MSAEPSPPAAADMPSRPAARLRSADRASARQAFMVVLPLAPNVGSVVTRRARVAAVHFAIIVGRVATTRVIANEIAAARPVNPGGSARAMPSADWLAFAFLQEVSGNGAIPVAMADLVRAFPGAQTCLQQEGIAGA